MKKYISYTLRTIIVLMCGISLGILLQSCTTGEGIEIPTSPLLKFAPPRANAILDITPNPTPTGTVTQFWTITETDSMGFSVESILLETYDPAGARIDSTAMTQGEIQAITGDESRYFPPRFSYTGSREVEITLDPGSYIVITATGQDDNDYVFTFSETVTVQ